jgi:N-succinyldiaminopimelate aminotransferase
MAAWFRRRYSLTTLDPAREVLPVNGSREALFAFAQTIVDGSRFLTGRGLSESLLPNL